MIRYAIILIAAMGTVAGVAALQDAPAAAETAAIAEIVVQETQQKKKSGGWLWF